MQLQVSLSTSGGRNPRLQAKRRVGEVASCDEIATAITRCAFKVHLVWGKKYRFVLTSSTIMGKKMGWPRKTVGFKPTAFEPLALQARVVQFIGKIRWNRAYRARARGADRM